MSIFGMTYNIKFSYEILYFVLKDMEKHVSEIKIDKASYIKR